MKYGGRRFFGDGKPIEDPTSSATTWGCVSSLKERYMNRQWEACIYINIHSSPIRLGVGSFYGLPGGSRERH